MAAPIAALLFCTNLAACSSSGGGNTTSSGTAGAGGEAGMGGGGGNGGGGSGGNGGSMAIACSTEESAIAIKDWPWFGFEKQLDPSVKLSDGATATIDSVETTGMWMTFDAGGVSVRLAWAGSDLNQVFTAGDMVTVTTDAGLLDFRVSGTKGQAVILRYASADVLAQLPSIPGGGPSLALGDPCVFEQTKTCPLPESWNLYPLTATLGSDNAIIPSGKTVQVGNWQIAHIKTIKVDFYTAADCKADKLFEGTVHALEVKP